MTSTTTDPSVAELVRRLREIAEEKSAGIGATVPCHKPELTTEWQAADEIERLAAENARLQKERDYSVRWANRSVDSVKTECFAAKEAAESECASLRAALAEARGEPQWRTMDSAPKNWHRILLAHMQPEWWVAIGRWQDDCWVTDYDEAVEPTHWMPLPTPPQEPQPSALAATLEDE